MTAMNYVDSQAESVDIAFDVVRLRCLLDCFA